MKLAAVYIQKHKFLFNDTPQTLNFGGRYFYDFKLAANNEIIISRKENTKYIPGFYSRGITSVSAIVGANGTGKTNLLKIIHKSYQEDTPIIFLYEKTLKNETSYYVDNRIGKRDENGNITESSKPLIKFSQKIEFEKFNPAGYTELYYSPIYDKSIKDFFSILDLQAAHPEKTLEDIHHSTILKEVIFLYSKASRKIKTVYPDFPSYDNIIIKAGKLYKSDFTKVYIESNIGNPNKGETLKHTIERDLSVKNFPNPVSLLTSYLQILKGENITDILKEIWNLPKYKNEDIHKSHLVHDSKDFFNNIETALLSYIVLNDIFSDTELRGSFDFDAILKTENFEEMLDLYLAKYIIQIDRRFYSDASEIKIDQYQVLIEKCSRLYPKTDAVAHVDSRLLREKILKDIKGFKAIKDLYILLKNNRNLIQENEEYSYLNLSVKKAETRRLLFKIISSYTKVKKYFSDIPINNKDFIDFEADKKLSFGEKSLLNLYSTLYDFTLKKDHTRQSSNYLLILDEADLGYHPLWKRKYIDAIIKTLPQIFRSLIPLPADGKLEDVKNKSPQIQILFTTHDPLTLSDLPNSSIVFLKKENNYSRVLKIEDSERPTKTFGANISNLLSDSFFINDGLIGDFAKGRIEAVIDFLNELLERKNAGDSVSQPELLINELKKTIEIIDEPIIQQKLIEMFNTIFYNTLDDEIKELENRIQYLRTLKKDNQND